ncbi:MAG: hypothetical protein A2024_03695 [Candidatus Edwardsbacteria bacterium GWF2_54_11]|uniref:Uncharacterized protein n=1 Tax=Candidatus Edwardsbacteria bacterium GWF2_54_11 TaxID=1817851 RepID=A0A1F5RCG6_9BACT|nr:MAG: hypothetical protein A2024_03695 [Candidatus Edwardsbacteria bacterium GWF2_54_11]
MITLFKYHFYRLGLKLLTFSEVVNYNFAEIEKNNKYETQDGKFMLISSDKCIFRTKYLFKPLEWNPFNNGVPTTGFIHIKDGIFTTEIRLSLGITIFIVVWIIGFTSGVIWEVILSFLKGENIYESIVFLAVLIIVILLFLEFKKIMLNKSLAIYEQIKIHIS